MRLRQLLSFGVPAATMTNGTCSVLLASSCLLNIARSDAGSLASGAAGRPDTPTPDKKPRKSMVEHMTERAQFNADAQRASADAAVKKAEIELEAKRLEHDLRVKEIEDRRAERETERKEREAERDADRKEREEIESRSARIQLARDRHDEDRFYKILEMFAKK